MHRIHIVPLVLGIALGLCVPAVFAAPMRAVSPAPLAVLTVVTQKVERTAHRVGHKVSRAAHRTSAKASRVAHRAGVKASRFAHRAGRKIEHAASVARVKAAQKGAVMKARIHRALHRSSRAAPARKAKRRPPEAARSA